MDSHSIIILISPPRSLSTAFLRMMATAKKFSIINEPSSAVFNQENFPHSALFYRHDALSSYAAVKNKILFIAKNTSVFIKEMSFAFEALINTEPDLINQFNIKFILLLRNPHHSLISYYKKLPEQSINFILPHFLQLTGYQSIYNIYNLLMQKNIMPLIIHAEEFYINTKSAIITFCHHLNIPYQEEYLSWDTAFEWQESKKEEFIHHWHHEALTSDSFHQPTQYDIDENNFPTFNEINNKYHQEKCFEIYKQNKLFYDLIRN